MAFPVIYFVDDSGARLPTLDDDNDVQRVVQYGRPWALCVDGAWSEKAALMIQDASQEVLPLELKAQSGGKSFWRLPSDVQSKGLSRRKKDLIRNTAGSTGRLVATLISNADKMIPGAPKQSLHVMPANLTEQELEGMMQEIGLMALSSFSCAFDDVAAPIGESIGIPDAGMKWFPGRGLYVTATSLLHLGKVVARSWQRINRAPIRNLTVSRQQGRLPTSRLSPRLLADIAANPSRRRATFPALSDTIDCSENRFLVYVIERYLGDFAIGIARSLRLLDLSAVNVLDSEIYQRREIVKQKVAEIRRNQALLESDRENLKKRCLEAALQLEALANQSQRWIRSSHLQAVEGSSSLPEATLRLRHTPGYADVYTAFSQLASGQILDLDRVARLFHAIVSGQTRPTWELYEIWCVVKLYDAFLTRIRGMKVVPGTGLFENLQISSGALTLPKNRRFAMEATGHTQFTLSIWHEPYLTSKDERKAYVTPDILVKIEIASEGKHALPHYFVFDAKYRGYANRENDFRDDVIKVARDKYLRNAVGMLGGEKFELTSSFILQSEVDSKFDYWGEVPFSHAHRRILPTSSDQSLPTEYVGHRYGSIQFRPAISQFSTERQVRRILELMFPYHMGGSFQSMCFRCGKNAKRVDNSTSNTQGTVYFCDTCGSLWVVNHCQGASHHQILKLGDDSFHARNTKASGGWLFICPECGDEGTVKR